MCTILQGRNAIYKTETKSTDEIMAVSVQIDNVCTHLNIATDEM